MSEYMVCKNCGKNKHDPKWKTCFMCKQNPNWFKSKEEQYDEAKAGRTAMEKDTKKQGISMASTSEEAIADEVGTLGFVLDLCLEKALKIVRKHDAEGKFAPSDIAMLAAHLSGQYGKNKRTPN